MKPITGAVHKANFKLSKLFCSAAGIWLDFQSLVFLVRFTDGVAVQLKFGIILQKKLQNPMKALTSVIEVGYKKFCIASTISFAREIPSFVILKPK